MGSTDKRAEKIAVFSGLLMVLMLMVYQLLNRLGLLPGVLCISGNCCAGITPALALVLSLFILKQYGTANPQARERLEKSYRRSLGLATFSVVISVGSALILFLIVGYLLVSGWIFSLLYPAQQADIEQMMLSPRSPIPSYDPTQAVKQVPVANFTPSYGYAYMKAHTIGGNGGGLYGCQVKLTVHRGAGVDHGEDVYLDNHARSWPGDIRFTNSTDSPLSYWIEASDADTAVVWVKIDYIPACPEVATVKMYYGKEGDSGASSGQDTFVWFADFTDAGESARQWEEVPGSGEITVASGVLTIDNAGSETAQVTGRMRACTGYVLRYRVKAVSGGAAASEGIGWCGYEDPQNNGVAAEYSGGGQSRYRAWSGSGEHSLSPIPGWSEDTWHTQEILRYFISNTEISLGPKKVGYVLDDAGQVNETAQSAIFADDGVVRIYAAGPGSEIQVDWLLVRDDATLGEPLQGAWSKETTSG